MRINVYTEEMLTPPEVRIVEKNGFRGLRIYLDGSPRLHNTPEDDDRQAITFWGLSKAADLAVAIAQAVAAYVPPEMQQPDPFAGLDIKDMLDLNKWTEERGFGSDQGAKCPHCELIVGPHELAYERGDMACPACGRAFRYTRMEVGGRVVWSTLAPAVKP